MAYFYFFEKLVSTNEVGSLAPIAVVMLLKRWQLKHCCSIWTESGEPASKLFGRFATKNTW